MVVERAYDCKLLGIAEECFPTELHPLDRQLRLALVHGL